MVTIGDPWVDSPTPSASWLAMSDEQRLQAVWVALAMETPLINAISAHRDGAVIVSFKMPVNESYSGSMLRDAEMLLRARVDPAICIYQEAQQDRNRLRRLGGLAIKSDG